MWVTTVVTTTGEGLKGPLWLGIVKNLQAKNILHFLKLVYNSVTTHHGMHASMRFLWGSWVVQHSTKVFMKLTLRDSEACWEWWAQAWVNILSLQRFNIAAAVIIKSRWISSCFYCCFKIPLMPGIPLPPLSRQTSATFLLIWYPYKTPSYA